MAAVAVPGYPWLQLHPPPMTDEARASGICDLMQIREPARGLVDFSMYVPDPYVSTLMTDLSADVVQVGPPTGEPGWYAPTVVLRGELHSWSGGVGRGASKSTASRMSFWHPPTSARRSSILRPEIRGGAAPRTSGGASRQARDQGHVVRCPLADSLAHKRNDVVVD